MAAAFVSIEHYRYKFYQKENSTKRFMDLSEERLDELAKKAEKRKQIIEELPSGFGSGMTGLERYCKTMQYLTSSNIHLEFKSFDEKAAFLILMTDPNLVIYREFLKTNLVSISEIKATTNNKERDRLIALRNRGIMEFESRVREQLGFYDSKMLKYEEAFFRRFLSEKELITEVQRDNQDDIITRAKVLTSFDSISDERYDELMGIAQGWLAIIPEKQNSRVATYSVINQRKLLGINGMAEQLALFVLLVDSNLDMLRIYEEESRMPDVEGRILEEFGFFSSELLTLEKKFHSRFCPDRKISIWTKTKKD